MTLKLSIPWELRVSAVSIYLAYRLAEGNVTKRRVVHVLRIPSTTGNVALAFNLLVTCQLVRYDSFRYYIILCARTV